MKAENLSTHNVYKVINDGDYFPFLSYFKAVRLYVEYIDTEGGFIRVELVNKTGMSKFMRYPIPLFNSMGKNYPYRTLHNVG